MEAMSRILAVMVVSALALTAGAAPAVAAPPWSEPEAVPGSLDFGSPAGVAMGPEGHVAVVFVRDGIQLALRRPNGRWAATRKLSRGDYAVSSPAVLITRRGELVATWTQAANTSGAVKGPMTIQAVTGRVRGRLERPRAIGTSSHFTLAEPRPFAGARGHVAVVWRGVRGQSEAIRVAVRRPRGSFRRAEAVPDSRARHAVYYHDAAVGRFGGVHVTWTTSIGPAILYARRRPDGAWTAPLTLSGSPASRSKLAAAPDGTAVVAWHAAPPDSEGEGFRYAPLWVTTVAGTARPPRLLSAAPVHAPEVASTLHGEVLLTWSSAPNADAPPPLATSLHFALRPLGGDVGIEQIVPGLEAGAPAYAPGPRLVMRSTGVAVQAFGGSGVYATVRPPGGTFGAPEPISPSGDFPILSAGGGRVAALFMSGDARQLRLSIRR
jgi:hypothetical protein